MALSISPLVPSNTVINNLNTGSNHEVAFDNLSPKKLDVSETHLSKIRKIYKSHLYYVRLIELKELDSLSPKKLIVSEKHVEKLKNFCSTFLDRMRHIKKHSFETMVSSKGAVDFFIRKSIISSGSEGCVHKVQWYSGLQFMIHGPFVFPPHFGVMALKIYQKPKEQLDLKSFSHPYMVPSALYCQDSVHNGFGLELMSLGQPIRFRESQVVEDSSVEDVDDGLNEFVQSLQLA